MKKKSGKAPEIEGNLNGKTRDMSTVNSIIKKDENHSHIININNQMDEPENRYDIPLAIQQNKPTKLLKIKP